jgi:hypothetical protein
MYQENRLSTPGGITLAGTPIDLGKIKVPAYFLSTREDHIAPWKTTYTGTRLLGGKNRFVLAASGHIAGVVNPPEGGKYSHFVNTDLPPDCEEWFAGATEISGSWWPDWHRWITAIDAKMVNKHHVEAHRVHRYARSPSRHEPQVDSLPDCANQTPAPAAAQDSGKVSANRSLRRRSRSDSRPGISIRSPAVEPYLAPPTDRRLPAQDPSVVRRYHSRQNLPLSDLIPCLD